jgi:hypothetical protein
MGQKTSSNPQTLFPRDWFCLLEPFFGKVEPETAGTTTSASPENLSREVELTPKDNTISNPQANQYVAGDPYKEGGYSFEHELSSCVEGLLVYSVLGTFFNLKRKDSQ